MFVKCQNDKHFDLKAHIELSRRLNDIFLMRIPHGKEKQ